MKGAFEIKACSPKVEYRFTVKRKYTVIRGDSATGKTTLYNLLKDAESGDLSCTFTAKGAQCISADSLGAFWAQVLPGLHDYIVFVDEDSKWVCSEEFASIAKASDNYYVIINRHPLPMLPYSVKEIYDIKTSGRYHTLVPTYTSNGGPFTPECILTEDTGSGYDFFNHACHNCMSAEGKSNVFSRLVGVEGKCLAVVDGAAFGSEIERVVALKKYLNGDIRLYLPESFEAFLLRSKAFCKLRKVQQVLENTPSYVGTSYNSWEQFFTDFLTELTFGTPMQYSKSKLKTCYTEDCCVGGKPCQFKGPPGKVQYLLDQIPNVDFSKIRR